jgi:hypothetical protein
MNGFENREKGFERKYSVDQENEFKVIARRNRLLGAWAAVQMGLSGDAVDSYAKEVVVADFDEPGDADVVAKVLRDFSEKGIDIDEAAIRRKMEELAAVARQQLAR